jgi:shikimate dehydrogenase
MPAAFSTDRVRASVDAPVDAAPPLADEAVVGLNGKALVGLIGAGIQQSLTPAMHEAEARHHGLNLHYQLIDLATAKVGADKLALLLEAAKIMGFAGLNITYPCKQAVIPLLDDVSEEARTMGAVNTVVIRQGRAVGHNTDGSGWAWHFKRSLPQADLAKVVLLGSGGAGSAIAHAVLRLGARHVTVVDRDGDKAATLAQSLAHHHGAARVAHTTDVTAALARATGLIHATPMGTDKMPGMALAPVLLKPRLWVSEVVYFPIETALLKAARAAGCAVCDGGGMAVGQAVGAFKHFTGLVPDAARMHASFLQLLVARGF